VVTAVIASNKGKNAVGWFFLGCLLGVLGIILVVVLPSENDRGGPVTAERPEPPRSVAVERRNEVWSESARSPVRNSPASQPAPAYDARKWQVLKEVDTDIGAAAARVAAFGQAFEDELAEKYLILNDKSYLPQIKQQLIEKGQADQQRRAEITATSSAADAESSRREMDAYNVLIQANDQRDPRENLKVAKVEPYLGGWMPGKGGIKVTLENGAVVLRKGHFSRRFESEDETF
jgi:hypothetical protein